MTDEKKSFVTMDVVALERLIPRHAYVGDLTLTENLHNYIEWLKAEVDHWKGASKEHAEVQDEARAEVERLRAEAADAVQAWKNANGYDDLLAAYSASVDALRAVAERQREACASMVEDADDGVPLQCLADAIRAAPLVTEGGK